MDKKKLISAGKWAAFILLTGINYLYYSMNHTMLNLIIALAVLLYTVYEFFTFLSGKNLHLGIKMYLFTFYLFGVISLFMGLQSLLKDNFRSVFITFALIIGDIVLILYSVKKFNRT